MQQAEAAWEPGAASVAEARRFVARTLEAWGEDGLEWAATTVVSELASNAVLHAASPFAVRLLRRDDAVRVEVEDGSPVPPAVRRFGADATTGRGVRLVEQLSRAWGWTAAGGGKVVWCELPGDADAGGGDGRVTAGSDVDLDALLAAFGGAPATTGRQAPATGATDVTARAGADDAKGAA